MFAHNLLLAAKIVEWASVGLIPFISAIRLSTANPPKNPAILSDFLLQWLFEYYVTIVLILGGLSFTSKIVQESINPESKVRLKATVDAFFETYFDNVPDSERYTNRVTLFKANSSKSLLEPYCRSGTQYQRGIQSLRIDSNSEDVNEGVAGQAWFRNTTVTVLDLPESSNPWRDTDLECQRYAREGLLSEEKASKLHVKSRSLVATPLRDFKGNQWGVLVLDSRRPDGIDPNKEALVKAFAATLGKVL